VTQCIVSFFYLGAVIALLLAPIQPAMGAPAPTPDSPEDSSLQGMGNDIKKFGEDVAERIDRIIKKKSFDMFGDPWTLQGLPLIFPTSDNGFNLGLHIFMQDIRRQDPEKFALEGQVLASDEGRYKHFLRFDYPHALDGRYRITSRFAYDREISLGYYGIGNNTPIDTSQLNRATPLYQMVNTAPSFTLQFMRYFGSQTRIGPIIGLKWTTIGAPDGSLLQQQQPLGLNGGRTHYIGLAIINDTTDFEPYPSRGMANELYLNWYTPLLGSNYNFFRGTYFFRKYWPLHRTLIFAHRTMFEVLSGDIPFYEMQSIGGLEPTISFGGDKYFEGYVPNQYIDRIRLVFGFEFRWDPISFQFYKQDISIGFVPWVDFGRVWPSVLPIDFSNIHASTGWGARIIWNSRLIIRADFAINIEGSMFVINLGNSF
jgi:outer membrane protein assembly factor BamA